MLARALVVTMLSVGVACASTVSSGQVGGAQSSSASSAGQNTLSGRVTYRQRIALPPGAVVEVSLDDVSRADAAAQRLGGTTITTKGENVPIPFTLAYDSSAVRPERSYAVSARITIDGQLRWTSTSRHAVLTAGHPADDVTIMVDQVPDVRRVAATGAQPEESSLVGRWQLDRIEYSENKRVAPSSPQKYWVEFLANGNLVAQLDCNRGRGGYSVSGSTLKVDGILATLMACGGNSIYREFTGALQTATSFERTGDRLLLSMPNDAGTMHLILLP